MSRPVIPLQARIALRLGFLAILVSTVQTFWAVSGERTRDMEALRVRASRVVDRLRVALQAPLYSFDGAMVDSVVAAELAASEVIAVRVDGAGRVATWRGEGGVAVVSETLPDWPGLVVATGSVMEPPNVPSPQPLAKVTAVLSPHLVEAEWRELVLSRALETLALVVAITLASWAVLLVNVMRPLERLRGAMIAARQALSEAPAAPLAAGDPVAGLAGAVPELRAMGADFQRLAEAVRQSRATLAEREADLRATLDSIGDGVITTGLDGAILAMNPVAERLTGVAAPEALGRPLGDVFSPGGELAGLPDGLVPAVLARGTPLSPAEPLPLHDHAGRERFVTVTAAPVRRSSGHPAGVVVVFRDVSAQRTLEEKVWQAQKVEAIGQLAGGVAHDFNNMLTPVLAYGQLIRETAGTSEEVRQYAEVVVETATRAAALTRQLLAFSRKGSKTLRTLSTTRLVEETATLLRRTIDRSIDVQLDLKATGSVRGDAALLQNALLNLALNSRDAMPYGGILRLTSRDVRLDEKDCAVEGFSLSPGPHVELGVADTGVGMPPEVVARIFEPFYTTKEAGKGTGLGLAAVHGTVTEFGGAVLVHSVPKHGTTIRLFFPAVASDQAEAPAAAAKARHVREGLALVVEDEPRIRQLVVRELTGLGYRVVEAADGLGAMSAVAAPVSYDLAVLDLVLPRASGRQVFLALRAQQPDVPVLLTSGFAREGNISDLLEQPSVGFLEKPWRPSELLDAVEQLLG